jgi:Cys-tRNA(Pro) deacylase
VSDASERVRAALQEAGVSAPILEFAQGTRTAVQAAAAVGTTVAQIVKSLLFVADGRPVLALVSGAHRLDEGKLARTVGASTVHRAGADLVREVTGFAIGGVPPVGHARPLPIYIDRDLLRHDVVYAAAGTPHAVFPISPADLVRVTGGVVADLRAEDAGFS